MAKRPTQRRNRRLRDSKTAPFSAAKNTSDSVSDQPDDDFDVLENFDPDSDESCWEPGEIDLDQPDFDPRDFCLEDSLDDDG